MGLQTPEQTIKDLGIDVGSGDYLRMAPATETNSLLSCENLQCKGVYPEFPKFRTGSYPGTEFWMNSTDPKTKSGGAYAGRAYSSVSDPLQKGSVEVQTAQGSTGLRGSFNS